ncbi:hypothetical protein [Sanguibacter sp. 25GB23B1]|uniref:hypothetical protein n=1 Tax=unclassified Sanguibacter TaxID=2645534 RepID=UPI0032AEA945
MRSAEYDAFGPWIVPVGSLDLVPPLYRDHPLDLERAVTVLKVPRNITRRDATPDMDLYDHLIVVEPDRVELLSRSPGGYDVLTVEHSQIAAIDYGADLLDGWLTLFATGAAEVAVDAAGAARPALALRYNASSEGIVDGLVATLRRLALGADRTNHTTKPDGAASGHGISLGLLDLGERDVGLVTAQHALVRAEPDVRVLGFHARRTVTPRSREMVGRIVDLVLPSTLQAGIVCASDGELHVLRRRRWVTRSRRPEHSIGRTVLLLERCGGASVRDDETFVGTRVFSVPVGGSVIDLVVPAGSSSERALSDQLAVPLR